MCIYIVNQLANNKLTNLTIVGSNNDMVISMYGTFSTLGTSKNANQGDHYLLMRGFRWTKIAHISLNLPWRVLVLP